MLVTVFVEFLSIPFPLISLSLSLSLSLSPSYLYLSIPSFVSSVSRAGIKRLKSDLTVMAQACGLVGQLVPEKYIR